MSQTSNIVFDGSGRECGLAIAYAKRRGYQIRILVGTLPMTRIIGQIYERDISNSRETDLRYVHSTNAGLHYLKEHWFIMMDVNVSTNGVRLPGAVVLRGKSVAVLIWYHRPVTNDVYVVLVRQPRIATPNKYRVAWITHLQQHFGDSERRSGAESSYAFQWPKSIIVSKLKMGHTVNVRLRRGILHRGGVRRRGRRDAIHPTSQFASHRRVRGVDVTGWNGVVSSPL